jgi:hypothetical protein
METYQQWRQEMAKTREVCLACEFEDWAKDATANELEACQPNADRHFGPYCHKIKPT